MSEQEKKKEPIKVTDRRAFTPQGERRTQAEEPPPKESRPDEEAVRGQGFELRHGPQQRTTRPLPGVEFSSFILSLASTAFIQLGDVQDPVTGKTEINLEAARQMIDIIDMLRVKTRGNLDPQEDEFLAGVLYELKVKFAQRASAG